ncbi:MAG: glycogen debranching enzyme N-terminal domain-containing protein, partial [Abitibacteriaceae bacterium]|nr:glycogen debranching enzyme N-terminal domain-containing protein [Abditibacteriaceae bacterium]
MDFNISREWLETNGIGGFASSTVLGCNTRRYHALLCAATKPPLGRMVLVNKADETLTVAGRSFDLGCNQYPGTIYPSGYQFLRDFVLDPLPRWIYVIPHTAISQEQDVVLQKTVWMPYGHNTTVMRYELLSGDEATLTLHPFITGRDYHHSHHYNGAFNGYCERRTDQFECCHIKMQPYTDCPFIQFSLDGGFNEGGAWYYSFEYEVERERGLDFTEDAYCPGAFVWHLTPNQPATLVITAETELPLNEPLGPTYEKSRATEITRRQQLSAFFDRDLDESSRATPRTEYVARLARGADQFIAQRGSDGLHTILAGYPWFSDWGRDTMIALPGLCLTTQRYDIAASILKSFAEATSQGMIPNRFPDAGETPDYNTVDATLWYFHAAAKYLERSGDWDTIKELYPTLRDCIDWHLRGTRYDIRADPVDGLLHSGEPGTQLTWMDAKVGDHAFTPRVGKPVEIQSLWYNALRTMMDFAGRMEDKNTKQLCGDWSRRVKSNFQTTFWNETANCLYDVVNDDHKDGSIRPNQILVVSLPHRLITADCEQRVVAAVQRELLTPYGLRSLSPNDPQYRGVYSGNQWERDSSYHQGTVWAWLIGPFFSAYLRANRNSG